MSTTEAAQSPREVHIAHVIRASRSQVYDAWTKPEQIVQWRGPIGWTIVEAVSEAVVGGKHRVVVRGTPPALPGREPEELTGASWGTYTDLIPGELIRFTWLAVWVPDEESAVTIRLADAEGGTLLDFTHDHFATQQSAQMHIQGWEEAIGKLTTYLEAH